jgi:AcrR family transcriptional regulator
MSYVAQDDRRRQLIEATIRVLQRDGVGQVTTRAITLEAGAPLASIHYTFGSKDDLVRAAFEHVIAELVAELNATITPGRGMAAAVGAMCTRVGQLLEDPRFAIVLGDLTPTSDPWMRVQVEGVIRFCEDILRREAEAARSPPPAIGFAQASRLLMAGIDGLIMQFEMHRDAKRARSDLAVMATLLGAALGEPRAGSPSRRGSARRRTTPPR